MILTYGSYAETGGSLTVIRQEVDYFSKQCRTFVFCRKVRNGDKEGGRLLHFRYPILPTRPLRLVISLFVIFMYLVRYSTRYDVTTYHAHDIYVASVAAVAGKLLGIRVVLTVHGPASYEYSHFFSTPSNEFRIKDRLYVCLVWVLERFAYKHVDVVAAVSNFEMKSISTVRTRGVFVVRNGIDLTVYRPATDQKHIRRLVNLPVRRKVVTFVGRMVPKNGILVIAQAIPKVTKIREDVCFLIVGDGFAKEDFRAIISQADVSSKVILAGEKSDPVPYYQISDLFVSHVSSLVEGVGLAVLEAIACGVPVVVGDDPISRARLSGVAHFVNKDDPSALAQEILTLLNQDLGNERRNLRTFGERNLSLAVTFRKYWELLRTGEES